MPDQTAASWLRSPDAAKVLRDALTKLNVVVEGAATKGLFPNEARVVLNALADALPPQPDWMGTSLATVLRHFESEANGADELMLRSDSVVERKRYSTERDTYRYVLKQIAEAEVPPQVQQGVTEKQLQGLRGWVQDQIVSTERIRNEASEQDRIRLTGILDAYRYIEQRFDLVGAPASLDQPQQQGVTVTEEMVEEARRVLIGIGWKDANGRARLVESNPIGDKPTQAQMESAAIKAADELFDDTAGTATDGDMAFAHVKAAEKAGLADHWKEVGREEALGLTRRLLDALEVAALGGYEERLMPEDTLADPYEARKLVAVTQDHSGEYSCHWTPEGIDFIRETIEVARTVLATRPDTTPTDSEEALELEKITDRLREFREQRGWTSDHTPRNLAVSIAVETGELLELFQWDEDLSRPLIAGELADVLIYALNLADVLDIDPAKAINEKITVNELRFPVPGETRPVGGA